MLSKGSRSLDVKELQQNLKKLGYDPGTIDGFFGEKTENAVLKFQSKTGLKQVDGIVGPLTNYKIQGLLKKLSSFKGIERELQGFGTVEDAGHGGKDPGAVDGKNDDPIYTEEKDITLAVTLKFHDKLVAKGARATTTRDGDEYPSLLQRCEIAKGHKANAFISVHCNSAGPKAEGIEVLYNPKCDKSKQLATFTLEEIVKLIPGIKVRGIVPRDNLFILNVNFKNGIPSIIAELGFITNPKEEKRLNDPAIQDLFADGLTNGVIRFKKGK